jgi:hypothetical protein
MDCDAVYFDMCILYQFTGVISFMYGLLPSFSSRSVSLAYVYTFVCFAQLLPL